MTCRCHGGPSGDEHASRQRHADAESYSYEKRITDQKIQTLEAQIEKQRASSLTTDYDVERVTQIGAHLVMQVRYPNCEHRAYEGLKTMVFLSTSALQALSWRSIDPHFRGRKSGSPGTPLPAVDAKRERTEAPSPAARFPGDDIGWTDAITYAQRKV